MPSDGRWGRRALSFAAIVAAVVVAMIALNPSRPESSTSEPGPTQTQLSPAEEYAYAALTTMGDHSLFVDEQTWWPGVVRDAMAAVKDARTPADTYGALTTALAAAAGPQGRFVAPADVPTSKIPALPSVSDSAGIGRITVASIGPVTVKGASDRATALADTIGMHLPAASCGWIIDVRETRSREDWGLLAGLNGFLQEGPAFDLKDRYSRVFHATIAMGSVFLDGRPMATASHQPVRTTTPVAVLQSGETSGAGEALVLALRQNDRVRTFGMPTRGIAFMEQFFLSDGAELILPTARLTDREGHDYTTGIPARIGTDAPEQAAITWLQAQCRHR